MLHKLREFANFFRISDKECVFLTMKGQPRTSAPAAAVASSPGAAAKEKDKKRVVSRFFFFFFFFSFLPKTKRKKQKSSVFAGQLLCLIVQRLVVSDTAFSLFFSFFL